MSLSFARQDCALVVGLGLNRKQAAIEEGPDFGRQIGQSKALLPHPMTPVFLRAVEHRSRPYLADVPLNAFHFHGI